MKYVILAVVVGIIVWIVYRSRRVPMGTAGIPSAVPGSVAAVVPPTLTSGPGVFSLDDAAPVLEGGESGFDAGSIALIPFSPPPSAVPYDFSQIGFVGRGTDGRSDGAYSVDAERIAYERKLRNERAALLREQELYTLYRRERGGRLTYEQWRAASGLAPVPPGTWVR